MSNTQTLATMRARVRRRADMENTDFVSDAELTQYLNDSLSELYDLFVSKYEQYVVQSIDSTISGEEDYDIATDFGIGNFMKIIGIDLNEGSRKITLQRFMFNERNQTGGVGSAATSIFGTDIQYAVLGDKIKFMNDQGSKNIKIWFIPCFEPMLEADQVDDVAPFLCPGWEEYAILASAIKCLQKEESSTVSLERDLVRLTDRIESIAMNRDAGNPYRVTDINATNLEDAWYFV